MRLKTIHIEFTTACNSQCVMCDYWKGSNPQTIDSTLVFSVVDQQYPQGLKNLYFTGGECLLRAPELFSLCRRVRNTFTDIHLGLITNGLLIRRYCQEIAELFHKVIVSLDALDPAKYKKIRGVAGVEAIQEGICLLKKHNPQIQVNLRVLVLRENVDELFKIVEYAQAQKLERVSFIAEDTDSSAAFGRTVPVAAANGRELFPLHKLRAAIEQIKTSFCDQEGTLLRSGVKDLERVYDLYAGKSLGFPPCDKAAASCVISADGTVSPCFFISGTQRLLSDMSLDGILSSEEYGRSVQKILAHQNSICCKCACPKNLS